MNSNSWNSYSQQRSTLTLIIEKHTRTKSLLSTSSGPARYERCTTARTRNASGTTSKQLSNWKVIWCMSAYIPHSSARIVMNVFRFTKSTMASIRRMTVSGTSKTKILSIKRIRTDWRLCISARTRSSKMYSCTKGALECADSWM